MANLWDRVALHFSNGRFLVVVAFLLVIGASTFRLTESPAVWYDEGFITQTAMNLAQHGREVLQIAPDTFVSAGSVSTGYPLVFPVSLSFRLFGISVLASRAVMVLFMIGFFFVSYLLMKKLHGDWFAGWSSLLVATLPLFYGNGKSVLGEIPGLFFLSLTLLLLLNLEKNGYRSYRLYIAAGLCAGLCIVTKPIFFLLLPAIAAVYLLRFRRIHLRWSGFAAGVLACAVPVVVWLFMQFGTQDTLGTILSFYANPYEVSNFEQSALSAVWSNIKLFFSDVTPLYTLGAFALWGVSLGLRRKKEAIASSELAAFVFCALILLAFLRLPGWYRYMFPATMVAILFVPYAGVRIYTALGNVLRPLSRLRWLPYALLTLLVIGQCYQLARGSYVASYYASHRTRDLDEAVGKLPAGTSVFAYNVPEVVPFVSSHPYYQYIYPHQGGTPIGAEVLPTLDSGTVDFVIAESSYYKSNPDVFSKYALKEQVNRYVFLERRQ